ncbi:MAG: ribosome silencing factor [Spirochaetaceae bacterium]|jgi:ribosome-associated protein|nr:ribosome silencing factor [Spirochaetaceae bacterium]
MEDMLIEANKFAELLKEHKGGDVTVLDLRQKNAWTDFFVIATVTSRAHTEGLLRFIKEKAEEDGLEILRHRRKLVPEDEWALIDMGNLVIHLMTEKSRAFYELERLWA